MGREKGKATNRNWIFFQITLVVAILAAFAGMQLYVRHINNSIYVGSKGVDTSKYELNLVASKAWSETFHGYEHGMQYDGTVTNYMKENVSDWEVTIQLIEGCHLDSYWNGEFTFENNQLTIKPMEHNREIDSGAHQTFGFILYAPSKNNIKDYQLMIQKHISMKDLLVYWLVIAVICIDIVVNATMLVLHFKTRMLLKRQTEFQNIVNQSFLTFSSMIDAKDAYTKGHSYRVAVYSRELARRIGLNQYEQERIYYIALLHDIGKIGIPDAILKKKGKLDADERATIEQHVKIGGDILQNFNAIPGIEDGARYHHERYDGKGYVSGLKGKDIPLYARIICVADSFDAMSSARCYRPKLSMDVIVEELKNCSGTQFDPEIVPHMLQMIDERIAPVEVTGGEIA